MLDIPNPNILRILDASLNRAGEGLRVVEDYLRMVLGDGHLARLAKQLRHDLADAARTIDAVQRHASRDTLGDVGTTNATDRETVRSNAADVAAANFRRTAEALRTIEEYGKLIDRALAADCEQLRYRLYTLEKATCLTSDAIAQLSAVRLYVLVDGRKSETEITELITSLVAAGVGAIQLRDKSLDDRELLNCSRALVSTTRSSSTLAIINDRPDIATATRADGVHLGQDDMPVAAARKVVGPRMLIGVSTHCIEQARQAVLDGANYLGAGPTFASTTKDFAHFPGLDFLRQVADEISLPTFAIGGITADNLPDVLATGIKRVAVAGAVTSSNNPADVTRELLEALKNDAAAEQPHKV